VVFNRIKFKNIQFKLLKNNILDFSDSPFVCKIFFIMV